MLNKTLLSLLALAAVAPFAVVSPLRPQRQKDRLFWGLLALASVGGALFVLQALFQAFSGTWDSSLVSALWISNAVALFLFAGLCLFSSDGRRLAPLLLPYLLLIGALATVIAEEQGQVRVSGLPEDWLLVHILAAVVTYGLATLAAVAALAVFLQERRLRRKAAAGLTAWLPSVAAGERLQYRLLLLAEVVLGTGLITGFALRYFSAAPMAGLGHKSVFSLLAFGVIMLLLWLQRRGGLRGRRAARGVLLAYLLLTLAYPGVKFVTDVLLS